MVRRGWSALDVPSGWIQVLRGPRPPSQQWPSTKRRATSVVESPAQRQQRTPPPIPSSHAQQNRQPARAPEVRVHRSPDEVAAAGQQRVQRLEAALQTLGDEDTPEVKSLQDALKKAKVAAQGIPVGVHLEECQKFVARCEKRIAALDVERSRELERLEEGKSNLERLRQIVASQ